MKLLKRFSYILLILVLFNSQTLSTSFNAEANAGKTLRDLKNELADWEKQAAENKNKQKATEGEISATRAEMVRISKEKEQMELDIEILEVEIEQLNEDIEQKNEELREIMIYYQLTATGEDAYLEYIFTASDFTDFVYRMAIAEQLSEYNRNLIDEYNDMILRNENLKKEKEDKIQEIDKKSIELASKVTTLQKQLAQVVEGALDINEEIKNLKTHIKVYEQDYKCPLDQLLSVCEAGRLPPGTAFYRPVVKGRVSSNWGNRTYMLNGKWTSDFHYGVDFAASHGTPVYSAGNGRVVAIVNKSSCGGNMIYVTHLINGKKYTTAYYHLAKINVKVGQTVYYTTQIGTVGGNPKIETWDKCTTGAHLHFGIANGHYLSDYTTYSGFISKAFNPRNIVNMPALGVNFTDRNRKY